MGEQLVDEVGSASCARWRWSNELPTRAAGRCSPGAEEDARTSVDASIRCRHRAKATLINCFVQPIADSISGDDAASASTTRSTKLLRPCAVAAVSATTSRASARVARTCAAPTAAQAGRCRTCACSISVRDGGVGWLAPRCADGHPALRPSRRGGVHHAKDGGGLTNFNISVAVKDDFMPRCATTRSGSWCTPRRRRRR